MENILYMPAQYNLILMTLVCVIYTSIGGLRGVIWTDVFQSMVMISFMIVIIIIGLNSTGITGIYDELERRQCTQLHYNPSPFIQNSVWIVVFQIPLHYNIAISQSSMLRYTGLQTLTKAKVAVIVAALGITI